MITNTAKPVVLGSAVVILSALMWGTPCLAQSWSIKSGRNIGTVVPSETRKLPDGSTYVSGGSKQYVETEDPTYPVTGQSMECRWVCKVPLSGSGGNCISLCVGVDKDGDMFSFRATGFGTGSYEVGPGTGKYSRASGGGTFEAVPADDPVLAVTRWKGTLQIK